MPIDFSMEMGHWLRNKLTTTIIYLLFDHKSPKSIQ